MSRAAFQQAKSELTVSEDLGAIHPSIPIQSTYMSKVNASTGRLLTYAGRAGW